MGGWGRGGWMREGRREGGGGERVGGWEGGWREGGWGWYWEMMQKRHETRESPCTHPRSTHQLVRRLEGAPRPRRAVHDQLPLPCSPAAIAAAAAVAAWGGGRDELVDQELPPAGGAGQAQH